MSCTLIHARCRIFTQLPILPCSHQATPDMTCCLLVFMLGSLAASKQVASHKQPCHPPHAYAVPETAAGAVQAALRMLLFQKGLRLSVAARTGSGVGAIVNLAANDAERFTQLAFGFCYLLTSPFQVPLCTACLPQYGCRHCSHVP